MKFSSCFFETYNICNLNCNECYNASGNNLDPVSVSANAIREFIGKLKPHGLKTVFFSGGEPTLHPDFKDLLSMVPEQKDIDFTVISNGVFFSPELIDTFHSNDNLFMQISLDGSDEETNSINRGPGNFEKTIKTIKALAACGKKPKVKMIVSKNTRHCVDSFYRLIVSLGGFPSFIFLIRSGNAIPEYEDRTLSDDEKISVTAEIKKLNEELGVEALLPIDTLSCPLYKDDPELGLTVTPDGSIYICSFLCDHRFLLGNIDTSSMEDIISSVRKISDNAKKRLRMDYGCKKCYIRSVCKTGCPGEAFLKNRDFFANDGLCNIRKKQVFKFGIAEKIKKID